MKNIGSYPNVRLRRNRKLNGLEGLSAKATYLLTTLSGQFLSEMEKILKNLLNQCLEFLYIRLIK